MKNKKILADYWREHYSVEVDGIGGYCCLCGNKGIIDTTKSAITPRGQTIGKMVYCICPNGRKINPND